MKNVSYQFAWFALALFVPRAHAATEVTCVLNPMVFDEKGEAHVADGASERLKFEERRVQGGKGSYLISNTVLTHEAGGLAYKVYLTATIEHKKPDLLRVISRVQTEVRGRETPAEAKLFAGPIESSSWFQRPEEFPDMPLTALTLSHYPNSGLYERYLNSKGPVDMTTGQLEGVLLEDAGKNPAQYQTQLYSLELQCMGRQ